jgi:N-acetylglucosamine-6-sulfatase
LLPLLGLLAVVICGGCSATGGSDGVARGDVPHATPNVVVIVTDDQTVSQFSRRTMPRTHRLLVDEGTAFTNAVVTTPLCCPSRASFLTGQYTHNNGVVSNTYLKLTEKENVLPAWLQHAGYTTAHVGKYLNNYAKSLDRPAGVAPGWDDWFTVLEPERYGDYRVSDNGEVVEYGWEPRDHLTRVLNDRAVEVVDRLAKEPESFYLQLDHYAPHAGKGNSSGGCPGGAAPERRDRGRFPGESPPAKPSFDGSVAGKSSFVRALPKLEVREIQRIRARWRCALEALTAVDRGVERIVTALRRAGELEDTAILFTSDNGYYFGEHRIAAGKHFPYEEGIRVPLVIRPPQSAAAARGVRSHAPVANIDLAPTVLRLASATPCVSDERCREIDGRSMVPLLSGSASEWPSRRPLLIEVDLPPSNPGDWARPCRYRAVRTAAHVYINYMSGGPPGRACEEVDEEELYSLAADPSQVRNLLAEPSAADEQLARRLRSTVAKLERCHGRAPAAEGCP